VDTEPAGRNEPQATDADDGKTGRSRAVAD
jgi:hypothetical protein